MSLVISLPRNPKVTTTRFPSGTCKLIFILSVLVILIIIAKLILRYNQGHTQNLIRNNNKTKFSMELCNYTDITMSETQQYTKFVKSL